MESKIKIALLGGDLRQYAAAVGLARMGWNVRLWGMEKAVLTDENIKVCNSIQEATEDAFGIVLPLPVSTDGATLNCPLGASVQSTYLTDLLDWLIPGTLVIGGKFPEAFLKVECERGIRCVDYYRSEVFQMENAYLTAEAAIGIAMNHLDVAIKGSSFAITGFGRIAKHLASLLKKLGADITVIARKPEDLALAQSFGCHTISLYSKGNHGGIPLLLRGFDVIYNTVPSWLFDRTFLENVDPHTFLIDLASSPGGVDVCVAKELGSNVVWATSLPGKYAPRSAGTLISTCVKEILREEVTDL